MKKIILSLALLLSSVGFSADLSKEQSEALKKEIEVAKSWASDAKIIEAVKAVNATPVADLKDMNQDKWKALPILDSKIKALAKHAVSEYLKGKKSEAVSEMFLNAADGTKVAFFAKTSSWSHKGKPKHDEPMSGKVWQGNVETDDSTGTQQIQIAVPVMDGGKSIGSLVVGYAVSKLK
jgi:hypothetical protein